MKVISKKEAAEAKSLMYFTGIPCKNGHTSPRYVSTSICVQCSKERKLTRTQKDRQNLLRRERYQNDEQQRLKNRNNRIQWGNKNKPKLKEDMWRAKLKREYGITPKEFDDLYTKQEGRCAICGHKAALRVDGRKAKGLRVMNIDHDHTTGKVRGLLCHSCNNQLGIYEKYCEVFETYLGNRIGLDVPSSIKVYTIELLRFFLGMLEKLDRNSFKSTPTRKDVHQITALLLREVAEFLEQVSEDRTDDNTYKELYDIANFAFLAAVALKRGNHQ